MPTFEPKLIRIPTSPNWYVQWFEDGRTQRRSTGTKSEADAKDFLAAFRLADADQPADDMAIGAALDWYWEAHGRTRLRSDSTELGIRYLKPFFAATPASKLSLDMQERFVAQRRKDGAGDESIRRDLSVLSAALNRAVKYKKLDRAPPYLTVKPAPPRERWLTRDEVARLFVQMRTLDRGKRHDHVVLFARLALYTGARTMAILDLTWDRVNFETGLIDYRVPGRVVTKKRRVIAPMTKRLRRMLLHAKKHARGPHVISWAGERIHRVSKACNSHAEQARISGFSPHILRHTFASWAVQRGVPLYIVGKALGQTAQSTTERYAKLAPSDVLAAMETATKKGPPK